MLRKQFNFLALFTLHCVAIIPFAFGASCTTQGQMTPAQRE